jgi:hypothetical protein
MVQLSGPGGASDADLLAHCELDGALGLTTMAAEMLAGARRGQNGRHALAGLTYLAVSIWPSRGLRGRERRRAPAA